ncbi:hypothetical protein ACH4SP_04640 [Streptomyces sp. NPDC021093]|uniref:hypothetical protein n=1 Tax=Streptomyces sp. NPDC021093 TaxID=3365112 RepID=UPI00379CC0B1
MTTRANHRVIARATSVAASVLLAATGLLATSGTAHAEQSAAALSNGESLSPGARLDGGDTHLVMRLDGDLALYTTGANGTDPQLRWHSGTTGEGNRAMMRADGNLVVVARDGNLLWESRTSSKDCPNLAVTKLAVQSGGEMSILTMPHSEAPYMIRLWSASFGTQFPCGSATR